MHATYKDDSGAEVSVEIKPGTTGFGTRKPIAFKTGNAFEPLKHKCITAQKQFQLVITDSTIQVANFGTSSMKVEHTEGSNELEKSKALTVPVQDLEMTIGTFHMSLVTGETNSKPKNGDEDKEEKKKKEEVKPKPEAPTKEKASSPKKKGTEEKEEKAAESKDKQKKIKKDKEDEEEPPKKRSKKTEVDADADAEQEEPSKGKEKKGEEKAAAPEIKKPTIKRVAVAKVTPATPAAKESKSDDKDSDKKAPAKRASKLAEPKPKKETEKAKDKKKESEKDKGSKAKAKSKASPKKVLSIVNDEDVEVPNTLPAPGDEGADEIVVINEEPENPEEIAKIERELAEEEESEGPYEEEEKEEPIFEAEEADEVIRAMRAKKKFCCFLSGFNESEEITMENRIVTLKGEFSKSIIVQLEPVIVKPKAAKAAAGKKKEVEGQEEGAEEMAQDAEEEEDYLVIPPFVVVPDLLVIHTPLKITPKFLFCLAANVPVFYRRVIDDAIKKMKMPSSKDLLVDQRRINELDWKMLPKYLRVELKARGLKELKVKLFQHKPGDLPLRERRVIVSLCALSQISSRAGKRKMEEAEQKLIETAVTLATMFKTVLLFDGFGRCEKEVPKLPEGFGGIAFLEKVCEPKKGDIVIVSEKEGENEFKSFVGNSEVMLVTKEFVVAMALLGDSSMEYFKVEAEATGTEEEEKEEKKEEKE